MAAKQDIFRNNQLPQCKAENLNSYTEEINNAIRSIIPTLSDDDTTQLRQALVGMSVSGTVFDYSGQPNAIVLTPSQGRAGLFSYVDGARILFQANQKNTGATQVNISGLGQKPIKNADGSELSEGQIDGFVEIVYSSQKDCFELANGLPNKLKSLTPFCYGVIRGESLIESINVDSLTIKSEGIRVNMLIPASSVNYVLLATRDGDETAKTQTISYFRPQGDNAKTTANFTLIPKANNVVETDAGEVSFLVFDKGQTV